MSLLGKRYLADEELGKKYDDLNRRGSGRFMPTRRPSSWKYPRRRRIFLVVIGVYLLYLFFKHMPTDVTPAAERFAPRLGRPQPGQDDLPPRGPPPAAGPKPPAANHYYSGPLKFYSLAKSLYSIQGLQGYRRENKIVLFAAADLKSTSDLLPLACEMAARRLNRVHFAIMGREEISLEGIQEVNGINSTECPLFWHDARPDYGQWSTDIRLDASVRAGLAHIHNTLQPTVIIAHDESREELPFWNAARSRAHGMDVPLIGLPNKASDFMWMANLDAAALSAWNKAQIEILIQAPPHSSGSFIRLLNSLQDADYFGSPPGLTIELPFVVDPSLIRHLKSFKWPPGSVTSQLNLRRRIQPVNMTPQEASVRVVDAFYPRDTAYSHVLTLSPQTVLAPSYFHFLKYAVLKYKYSSLRKASSQRLLGISLELPSVRPTDDEPFSLPRKQPEDHPVFLWQSPNSNAALYFGDKWVEFQSFLKNRFAAASSKSKPNINPSVLSKKYPAWMGYMLEFIRARGYYVLYPSFSTNSDLNLATVHNELYQLPEEFTSKDDTSKDIEKLDNIDPSKPLSVPKALQNPVSSSNERVLSESSTISSHLQKFPGDLPGLESLSVLPYSDSEDAFEKLADRTEAYLKVFRKEFGGCAEDQKPRDTGPYETDDLFCLEEGE